jgi:hypothetical protein
MRTLDKTTTYSDDVLEASNDYTGLESLSTTEDCRHIEVVTPIGNLKGSVFIFNPSRQDESEIPQQIWDRGLFKSCDVRFRGDDFLSRVELSNVHIDDLNNGIPIRLNSSDMGTPDLIVQIQGEGTNIQIKDISVAEEA